eukprot:gene18405-24107_t
MSGIATGRLTEERKNWRKDHPPGFYARPKKNADDSCNLFYWEVGICGKEGTDWENGLFKVTMIFSENYPSKPPLCKFTPPIFHPNVFTNGEICLSILKEQDGWSPAISLKQIALSIQDLLTHPNPKSPAQCAANDLYLNNRSAYDKKIKEQTKKFINVD